jgi:signal transduction histidine kinase
LTGYVLGAQTGGLAAVVELRLRGEITTLLTLVETNLADAAEQARIAETARQIAETARLIAEGVRLELQTLSEGREEQRRLTHDIIAAGADPLIVVDHDYCITFTNEQATEALLGSGVQLVDELVGKSLLEVFPDMESTPFWARFRKVMDERLPVAFEEFYEPRKVWYRVKASPVGKGIAVFFHDITARRMRDDMLSRTEKLAAVGRMASSISHEINNPLESVTNLLYLIQHAKSIDPETRNYALLASSELARVSHIVTQTLKFHRQSTHATSTRASELLDGVLSLYQGRITTLGAKILKEYGDGDTMMVFAGDMRQVFANLVGNALDALDANGMVRLRTRRCSNLRTGEAGVRVTVADNGCGMSAETQRSIFEAFFTTKPATGTGLGLWVSHEIVRNHRGVIRCRSKQGPEPCGTVFSVFFPV